MSDHALLHEAMQMGFRLPKALRQGLGEATHGCSRCHFPLLERLHYAIEQEGEGGAILVSQICLHMKVPAPAVSRSLRVLERDGYITRTADPADRRKTWVRLTAKGQAARIGYESAAREYMDAVIARMGEENLRRLLADCRQLTDALTAETESRRAARGAPGTPTPEEELAEFPPHGPPLGME